MIHKILPVLASLLAAGSALAEISTSSVEYTVNGVTMDGYLAYDHAKQTPRPGILVIHDWMGLGRFIKNKTEELAEQGYVAFAADIYGKNIRPKNQEEASRLATQYKENRQLLRERVRSAFDKLAAMKEVDAAKIVVIGYCFGGTTALELARSGAPVVGTVSFHGGLSSPTPADAKHIKGRVLALHGADDPFVPPAEVRAFKKEMKQAHVRMKFISYPGAVHAFTNPEAGNDNSKGAAYNAEADKKSGDAFREFLKDVFQTPG
jgi:dienelactone hydrolase